MEDYKFTKEHTKIAKGIAIILMLTHHLFAFPDRILPPNYYIHLFGLNIEHTIGVFGKVCVAMYLFLSGYGLCSMEMKRKIYIKDLLNKIRSLYLNYWIVFILFIPVGFLMFNVKFNLYEFIKNFIGISSSYVGEWWFFRIYIYMILIFIVIRKRIGNTLLEACIKIGGLYFIYAAILFIIRIYPNNEVIKSTFLYKELMNILFLQIVFWIGYISCKFNLYSIIKQNLIKYKLDRRLFYVSICIILIILRGKISTSTLFDFIIAPIFIFASVNIIYDTRCKIVFEYLGKHSTNMWLTHSFFCYTYFQKVTYAPKISIIILMWLIILSNFSSHIVNYIMRSINSIHKRFSKAITKAINN